MIFDDEVAKRFRIEKASVIRRSKRIQAQSIRKKPADMEKLTPDVQTTTDCGGNL